MEANEFCNYAHMDKFGRVDKRRAKKKEGEDAKVAEKRPSDGSGKGTGENRQRNGWRHASRRSQRCQRGGVGLAAREDEGEGCSRQRRR